MLLYSWDLLLLGWAGFTDFTKYAFFFFFSLIARRYWAPNDERKEGEGPCVRAQKGLLYIISLAGFILLVNITSFDDRRCSSR